MFRIDDHIGIAIAGLTSDARVLRYVLPTSLTTSDAHFFSSACAVISCASKPWAQRWCSTDPSPSTDLYPPSPIVCRVPLLHSCGEADAPCLRGPSQHPGIRQASIRRRFPCHRAGPHRPTPVRVLTERYFVRVLRCLDRCAQPECQDLP